MPPTATLAFLIALAFFAPAAAATPADDAAAQCAAYAEYQDIYQACLDNLAEPGGAKAPDALPENGGEDTCICSARHRQKSEAYLKSKEEKEKEKNPESAE